MLERLLTVKVCKLKWLIYYFSSRNIGEVGESPLSDAILSRSQSPINMIGCYFYNALNWYFGRSCHRRARGKDRNYSGVPIEWGIQPSPQSKQLQSSK